MTTEQMRVALGNVYGSQWKAKVKSMPDNQVIAVYRRLQGKGIIK